MRFHLIKQTLISGKSRSEKLISIDSNTIPSFQEQIEKDSSKKLNDASIELLINSSTLSVNDDTYIIVNQSEEVFYPTLF